MSCNCTIEDLMKQECTCSAVDLERMSVDEIDEQTKKELIETTFRPVMTQGVVMIPAHESLSAGDVYYIGSTPVGIVLATVKAEQNAMVQLNFSMEYL